jgi:outer membrane receptor protein involved in Fe transport
MKTCNRLRAWPAVTLLVLCSPTLRAADSADPVETVVVTAARLDAARNGLAPDTGSSIYRLGSEDIQTLPLGDATPLNQVMLQAPGVVQDSYGQLHVRGDHANLQYRINGVVIPEAITGFGQSLDTHFASRLNFLTGALPAQYGYRTAGVIDIQTQGYTANSVSSLAMTTGSHNDIEGSADATGSVNAFSYSLIGSYRRNDLGIENPTSESGALHDTTEQAKGFGYLSWILDNQSRLGLMFGIADDRFQIPDSPDQVPQYALAGSVPGSVDSATLDANQREQNNFTAVSYQVTHEEGLDYQISLFQRHSEVHYQPDRTGDLVFNGIAADITRRDDEVGIQVDAKYPLSAVHTLRAGLFYNTEQFKSIDAALVFPADADGNQTSTVPLAINDRSRISGHTGGIYLQDQWQPRRHLTVNFGARFDKVNTVVDEQQLSPRLGLVYEISSATHLHLGYARYFTPPPTEKIDTTSIALFAGTTNALPSDANTAVRSERSHYYDVGIDHTVSKRLTLGLDAYYRKVQDLQDEGQFGNALIFSAFNYAAGRVHGVELTTSYRASHLSVYTNLAWSNAQARQVVTGQFNFDPDELAYISSHWVQVDHDQRWAGSAGIAYAWARTTLAADGLYGSGLRRGFANTSSLPSYTQLNLSAEQEFHLSDFGKLVARLALINAFDRVYLIRDGSGIGVGAPQYGPRRAVFATVRLSM